MLRCVFSLTQPDEIVFIAIFIRGAAAVITITVVLDLLTFPSAPHARLLIPLFWFYLQHTEGWASQKCLFIPLMLTLPWFCDFRFKTQAASPERHLAGRWFPLNLTVVFMLIFVVVALVCFFSLSSYFHTLLLLLPFVVITIVLLTPGRRFTRKKRGTLSKLQVCCEQCLMRWPGRVPALCGVHPSAEWGCI